MAEWAGSHPAAHAELPSALSWSLSLSLLSVLKATQTSPSCQLPPRPRPLSPHGAAPKALTRIPAAALLGAVSGLSGAALPCLQTHGAGCGAALVLPLLGILVATLLVWRQSQSRERASFTVSKAASGTFPRERDLGDGAPAAPPAPVQHPSAKPPHEHPSPQQGLGDSTPLSPISQ